MSKILNVDNISYNGILNNCTFSLEEKKFNVLFGNNGSGKTTLIKCICQLEEYSGSIYFKGIELTLKNLKQFVNKIGIITDFSGLLDGTCLYNISYVLKKSGLSLDETKRKAYEIAKKFELDGILYKDIKELNIVQKKSLMIAMVLVHNPELIIIDTSLKELNDEYRAKVFNYIKSMKKSTVLLVTSDVEDLNLADKAIILEKGNIIEINNFQKNNEELITVLKNDWPFIVEVSQKLKAYGLLNDVKNNIEEIVDEIWK